MLASPRLFIPRATPAASISPTRFRLPLPLPLPLPPPTQTSRAGTTHVRNGAGCRPLCRAALPPGDALPRAVTRRRPGQRATQVLQGHTGSGRHSHRHSRPACRRDVARRRAAHHPRAQVLPSHPHTGACQGPGRGSSQGQGQGPRARTACQGHRACPGRGSSQAQGQGPRASTACQGHRACPGRGPSHHRRGTGCRSPRARTRGASRRAGPGDQAHRGTRPRARQEEEAVVQRQEEEEEGLRSGSGRRGPRRQDRRGTHLRRRGPRAQRRLHRRRHRECRRKDHREDGGLDPGGAWRGGDARLDPERPCDPM